jgi:hypothetical protein
MCGIVSAFTCIVVVVDSVLLSNPDLCPCLGISITRIRVSSFNGLDCSWVVTVLIGFEALVHRSANVEGPPRSGHSTADDCA